MNLDREAATAELTKTLDYCSTLLREVDDHVARQDWVHADATLQKAVDGYRMCLIDIRILGTKTGMPT